jgi:hypothetical protein
MQRLNPILRQRLHAPHMLEALRLSPEVWQALFRQGKIHLKSYST